MTKDCLLHPVEILPSTLRYPLREIIALARQGIGRDFQRPFETQKTTIRA